MKSFQRKNFTQKVIFQVYNSGKTGRNTGIAADSVAPIRSSAPFFFFPDARYDFPLFRARCTFSTVSHTRVPSDVVAKTRARATPFVLNAPLVTYSKGTGVVII